MGGELEEPRGSSLALVSELREKRRGGVRAPPLYRVLMAVGLGIG